MSEEPSARAARYDDLFTLTDSRGKREVQTLSQSLDPLRASPFEGWSGGDRSSSLSPLLSLLAART